jgi:flagellar motor switch protein FliN
VLSQGSDLAVCEVLPQGPVDAPPPSGGDLWITAALSGALSGELAFRLDRLAACRLAQRSSGEAEEGGESLSAEQEAAVLQLFRKTAALVGTQLKPAGNEVHCQVASGPVPSWAPGATHWLNVTLPNPVALEIRLNGARLSSLQTIRTGSSISSQPADATEKKLGMLMEVELVVTMRFGGRRMLLKDILDLCAGSVVELDQQVHEPVDLLLDGKLIARGEVVVVDGNYGLRVTELLSHAGN